MPRFKILFRCAFLFLVAVMTLAAADQPERKRVALVVDDGPFPEFNADFLAMLDRAHVRVTFSHVGEKVAAHPELARAVLAAGHEIINHSYTHPHLNKLSDADIEQEVAKTQAAVRQATGYTPKWFWAPFLEYDDRLAAAVGRAGLQHYPWKTMPFIGSEDWVPTTPAKKFIELCTTGVKDRTVILLHEFPKVTRENLPTVIAELKKQGVEFVTFSELLEK